MANGALSLYWRFQVEVVFPQCEMCQFASRVSIIALKSVVLRTNWYLFSARVGRTA